MEIFFACKAIVEDGTKESCFWNFFSLLAIEIYKTSSIHYEMQISREVLMTQIRFLYTLMDYWKVLSTRMGFHFSLHFYGGLGYAGNGYYYLATPRTDYSMQMCVKSSLLNTKYFLLKKDCIHIYFGSNNIKKCLEVTLNASKIPSQDSVKPLGNYLISA